MSTQNALVQRKMLEQQRRWAKQQGIAPADIRPSLLKIYAKLTATDGTLYFKVSDTEKSVCGTEVRLKDSSLFFANLFGLGLHKAPIASGKEYPAITPIVTYPDKTIFADAAGAAVTGEAGALEMVYHSLLTMKTDQTVRLDAFATNQFRMVPTTQSGAAAHPSLRDLLIDISTSFYIFGDRKNEFQLQLPNDFGDRTNIAGGADSQNYAVLLLGGFEVVNAANSARTKDFARMVESKLNP